jgi:DNA polymerase (family 10)
MTREEIVAVFERMADIMQIIGDDDPNKVKMYRNLAITLSYELPDEIDPPFNKYALPKIKGIGTSTIDKIAELVDTGTCQFYEELKASIPTGVLDLLDISGVGPSTASKLYNEVGIDSLESLQEALDKQKLRSLKGMGKKTEDNIRQGLEALLRHRQIRLMGYVLPVVESIVDDLKAFCRNISISGDLRRKTEVIHEADIVLNGNSKQIYDVLSDHKFVTKIMEWKDNGGIVTLVGDVRSNIIIVKEECFGESLLYLTGSKSHIDGLNDRAQQLGLKQISLESVSYIGITENDIYSKLDLPFIVPELREGSGEIESILPQLLDIKDIKGDLHVHSTWSDGHESIEAMAESAKKLGYEYITISDHSISSKIANGLDVEQILNKMIEVREINEKIKGIEILMGSEVDILKDGNLDYPDSILEKLDVVIASVHSGFHMKESEMTKRIIKAIENDFVHIIGHPTGRLLGRRDPYAVNIDAIIDASAEKGKSLEINAYPDRLDLKDIHVRKAKDKGVIITINTDAHSISDMNFMKYGIYTARRGWLESKDVLNTLPLSKLMKWLKRE